MLSTEIYIQYIASILFVSGIGIAFCEWAWSDKGFSRFMDPLYRKVVNRYEYVEARKARERKQKEHKMKRRKMKV